MEKKRNNMIENMEKELGYRVDKEMPLQIIEGK